MLCRATLEQKYARMIPQAGRWKEELFIKRLQSLNYLEIAQNSKLLLDTVIKSILFETSKAMKFI